MRYRNPVIPGFNPDPSVCRVDDTYYLATSSFEYVPGVPLYRSRTLLEWEPIGHALTRDEQVAVQDVDPSYGIFAPTLRRHEGTFYLITTNVRAGGHFVVTADDPAGEWSDPTWLDAPGIDPDLFFDSDGTVYVTYRGGDHGIEQATVDLETGDLGEPRRLVNRLEGDYTEAPHVYEVDGTYYLLVAEGGTHTNHMVSIARADDPAGPYEPHPQNPILSNRNVSAAYNTVQATGHGDLFEAADGAWWIVFLGIRSRGGHPGWHHLGRETFLAPVTWDEGWPVVNGGDPIELEMSVPESHREGVDGSSTGGDAGRWETHDPFAGDDLGFEWIHRNNPERERYDVADGALVLHGSARTLEDRQPTFVGRRQQHFECLARTRLAFDPRGNEEAGLTAIYDEDHHYDLAVARRDGERRAVVRLRVGPATEVVAAAALPAGPVDLAIEADAEAYRFVLDPGGDREVLAAAPTRYLATEVAGGFTGVVLGPYATGNGAECEAPARFEDFAYRATE